MKILKYLPTEHRHNARNIRYAANHPYVQALKEGLNFHVTYVSWITEEIFQELADWCAANLPDGDWNSPKVWWWQFRTMEQYNQFLAHRDMRQPTRQPPYDQTGDGAALPEGFETFPVVVDGRQAHRLVTDDEFDIFWDLVHDWIWANCDGRVWRTSDAKDGGQIRWWQNEYQFEIERDAVLFRLHWT